MEVYGTYNISEVEEIALKFSEDNNIVSIINESGNRKGKKMWANEKPENGLDGGGTFKKGINKGKKLVNNNGKIIRVDTSDNRFDHINKNKVVVKDKNGNVFQVDVDNSKYILGEYIHINSGSITMYDVFLDKCVKVSKEEYLTNKRYFQESSVDFWVFNKIPYRVKDLPTLNISKYVAKTKFKNNMVTKSEFKETLLRI